MVDIEESYKFDLEVNGLNKLPKKARNSGYDVIPTVPPS